VSAAAEASAATVQSANTAPTVDTARTTPVIAGAMKMQALSIHPETTLNAVSSFGSRASSGTSTAWAGLVTVTAVEATVANRYARTGGPPPTNASAVAPMAAPCTK